MLLVLDDEVDELLVDVLLDEEVVDELLLEDDEDCVVSVDEGKNQSIIEFKSQEHKSVGKDRTNNNFENLTIHQSSILIRMHQYTTGSNNLS